MAQSSLIDIIDNKLVFNDKLIFSKELQDSKNIKVISIIGKARIGKSTFLNCLLTFWRNETQNIFQMSSGGNHCTNGIDVYNIPERNILLLDFQGIYLGNSSNDPKLLLLAYLLSDVIIFNETKMLSNITLQQFEPMLSFINYLKGMNDLKDFNPKLVFRISDMSLDIDPTTNMQDMLKQEEDQFQAIRECINDLFDNPYAVSTSNLDRKEVQLLKTNDFKELLDIPENGFYEAIRKINDYLECCESRKTISIFMDDLPKIISSINDEKAIDFKKLDIVKALGEGQIRDWIDALGTEIYTDIPVDGTSETFKNVIKRQDDLNKIIKDLDKTFKSIPKSIRDERSLVLKTRVGEKLAKATQENKTMAETLMENFLHSDMQNYILDVVLKDVETFNIDEAIKPLLNRLEKLENLSSHIHNVALLEFMKWKIELIKDVKKNIKTELDKYLEELNSCDAECNMVLVKFINSFTENINTIVANNSLIEPYSSILDIVKLSINNKIPEIINKQNYSCNVHRSIRIKIHKPYDMYAGGCKYTIKTKLIDCHAVINNDYKIINDKYINLINELLDNQGLEIVASARNKVLTEKQTFPGTLYYGAKSILNIPDGTCTDNVVDKLVINNPQTEFISYGFFDIADSKHEYMTLDYYKQYLEPIFIRTCEVLSNKGYIYKDDPELPYNGWMKFIKDITEIIVICPYIKYKCMSFRNYKKTFHNDYKRLAMLDIFEHRFKKELIKNSSK